ADQQGAHVMVVAKRAHQPIEPGPPASQGADLELLKRPGEPAGPHRDDVIAQLVDGLREPAGPAATQPALGLELDPPRQQLGIDERAEPTRGVGAARERRRLVELRDFGFVQLGWTPFAPRPRLDPQCQQAPIVDAGAEAAGDTPAAQGPVGRVEVDVAVEQRLDRPCPQSGRQRRQDEAVQQLETLDFPAKFAHPAPAQKANPARTYTRVPSTLRAAPTTYAASWNGYAPQTFFPATRNASVSWSEIGAVR